MPETGCYETENWRRCAYYGRSNYYEQYKNWEGSFRLIFIVVLVTTSRIGEEFCNLSPGVRIWKLCHWRFMRSRHKCCATAGNICMQQYHNWRRGAGDKRHNRTRNLCWHPGKKDQDEVYSFNA